MGVAFQNGKLHPQWGDKLSLADARRALKHFEEQVVYYRNLVNGAPANVFDDVSDERDQAFGRRHLPFAEGRVRLWTAIVAAKERGEPVQHLLHAAPRTLAS